MQKFPKPSFTQPFMIACVLSVFSIQAQAAPLVGLASYYKDGARTANGESFNPHGLTAAHRTLPFGTKMLVVNESNGKSVVVRINDRGPFIGGRIIDLSLGAANAVGLTTSGVGRVRLEVIQPQKPRRFIAKERDS
jgi:rare lipoprotein A